MAREIGREWLEEIDFRIESMISIRDALLFYKAMQMHLDTSYSLHVITHQEMVPVWSKENVKKTGRFWQEDADIAMVIQKVQCLADRGASSNGTFYVKITTVD